MTPDSALKLMPGSDRFPRTPEDFQSSGVMSMADFACDEQVLSLLRREMPDLEPPPGGADEGLNVGATPAGEGFRPQRAHGCAGCGSRG